MVTVSLISGTTAGVAIVTASATSGTSTLTQSVMVTIGGKTGTIVLAASPTTLPPDGTSSSAITATVTDNAGNPVEEGTLVKFDIVQTAPLDCEFRNNTTTITVPIENAAGKVTVSLIAATFPNTGVAKVNATVTIGSDEVTQSIYVTIQSSNSISVAAAPSSITSDNTDLSTITATLLDSKGVAVFGETVYLTTTDKGTFSNDKKTIGIVTDASGVVTDQFKVNSTTAGTSTITASYLDASDTDDITYAP
ncbi:MAG: hypothetical protein GY846_04395 [Deltaproteobacteria bacterium]|nr:hypothetical protein [Deltaproteobacteria bacterium]